MERMRELFENEGNAAYSCDTDRHIQRAGRWIEQSSFRPDILVGHVAVATSTLSILSTSPKARFRGWQYALCISFINAKPRKLWFWVLPLLTLGSSERSIGK